MMFAWEWKGLKVYHVQRPTLIPLPIVSDLPHRIWNGCICAPFFSNRGIPCYDEYLFKYLRIHFMVASECDVSGK